jgi:hypothetical protein
MDAINQHTAAARDLLAPPVTPEALAVALAHLKSAQRLQEVEAAWREFGTTPMMRNSNDVAHWSEVRRRAEMARKRAVIASSRLLGRR